MDDSTIIDITRQAILLTLKIGAPVMIVGLVVGLIIALFQALTQVQEMTLSFVPKILAIFIGLFVFFPFMAQEMVIFMQGLADRIVAIGL